MNHYMGFDAHPIGERNERTRGEDDSLRLQQRLREARGSSSGSRFVALAVRGVVDPDYVDHDSAMPEEVRGIEGFKAVDTASGAALSVGAPEERRLTK